MVSNKLKRIFLFSIIALFSCCMSISDAIIWDNPKNIAVYIPQGDDKTALMKKAFEEWQKKTQNNFVFKFVNSAAESNITVVFAEKNLDYYCGQSSALGCTKLSIYDGMPQETVYIVKRSPKGLLLANSQLYTIMRHEIGHALGLEHSQDIHTIMYPLTNLHISLRQDIRNNDIKDLYKIYGINPQK